MSRGNAEVLSAIATITGQSLTSVEAAFNAAKTANSDERAASRQQVQQILSRVRTRLGIAPAVDRDELRKHLSALDSLSEEQAQDVTQSDLYTWMSCRVILPKKYLQLKGSRSNYR